MLPRGRLAPPPPAPLRESVGVLSRAWAPLRVSKNPSKTVSKKQTTLEPSQNESGPLPERLGRIAVPHFVYHVGVAR